MSYATVDELQERWRPLDDAERSRAETLLEDAALVIDVECPTVVVRIDAGDDLAMRAATRVSCEMVKRAMMASVNAAPMDQFQQTGGPFSTSGTFVNPTGDVYLSKGDRRLLGCRRQKAFSVDLAGVPEVP